MVSTLDAKEDEKVSGFRAEGSGFWVPGLGFSGLGFRSLGSQTLRGPAISRNPRVTGPQTAP